MPAVGGQNHVTLALSQRLGIPMKNFLLVIGVLVLLMLVPGCGSKEKGNLYRMEAFSVLLPANIAPEKSGKRELEFQVNGILYRIAKENSEWYVWESGRKAVGFGATERITFNSKGGYTFER